MFKESIPQVKRVQAKSIQTKRIQATNIQAKGVQAKAIQAKSIQSKSIQNRSIQNKGAGGKSVQEEAEEFRLCLLFVCAFMLLPSQLLFRSFQRAPSKGYGCVKA